MTTEINKAALAAAVQAMCEGKVRPGECVEFRAVVRYANDRYVVGDMSIGCRPQAEAAAPDECVANMNGHAFGPHGINDERQCEWCGAPAATQPEQAKGPVIDLGYLALTALRETYVKAFGPLPPEIIANDVDWHIKEVIKDAALAIPASTAAIARGYVSGTCCNNYGSGGGKISLHYGSRETAEQAFEALIPLLNGTPPDQDAAVAAIEFSLKADEGMEFLRCWLQGDFDVCREEWPEAPEAVYIGADPLHPATRAVRDKIRTALAIPASTAATQPEVGALPPLPGRAGVSDAGIPASANEQDLPDWIAKDGLIHLNAEGHARFASVVAALPVEEKPRTDWIADVLLSIAEIPDRNSPEDQPEMMLVSGDELRAIIEAFAPATRAAQPESDVRVLAEELARHARESGFVVSIEQRPRQPLAMGNHEDIVTVYQARGAK